MKTKTRGTLLKHLLLPSFAAVFMLGNKAANAQTPYPQIITNDTPALYYRMEESQGTATVADSSGNNLNGTVVYNGANTFPEFDQIGIDSNSVAFDGGTDYISIPESRTLSPTNADGTGSPFSAECWVQVTAFSSGYAVPLDFSGPYYGASTYENSSGWNFYEEGNPAIWIFKMRPSPSLDVDGLTINLLQWYHLVGVYDGSTAYFYINGALQVSAPVTGTPPNAGFLGAQPGFSGQIGAGANTGQLPFSGNVDEVAVYDYPLTQGQILNHYTNGLAQFRAVASRPGFVNQPSSTTNYSGTLASFSVLANGTAPLYYQWKRGVSPILNATNANYSFTCVYPTDNGATFSCVVSNSLGSTNSAVATLTVLTNINLLYSPFTITRRVGSKAAFRTVANGALPLSYQWYANSSPVGGNSDTLWLTNVQLSASGNTYYCKVSNPFTSVNSSPATLTVQSRTVTVSLSDTYGTLVTGDSPVAYLRLDEPSGTLATDAVGSFDGQYTANAGTFTYDAITGIPNCTDGAIGITAGAVVDIPYALELNPVSGPWSFETWVKPASTESNYRTVASSMNNTNFGNEINGWLIYQTPAPGASFVFNMYNGGAGGSFNPGTNIIAGSWYHLVIADTTTNIYFYANGVLVSALPQSYGFVANGVNGDPSVVGGQSVLGLRGDNFFDPFDGTVDDTAFYNYALSAQQVLNHYNNSGSVAHPTLSIAKSGNNVVVTWSAGVLQSATSPAGPFTAVGGSPTSPYTNAPSGKLFYRASAP